MELLKSGRYFIKPYMIGSVIPGFVVLKEGWPGLEMGQHVKLEDAENQVLRLAGEDYAKEYLIGAERTV